MRRRLELGLGAGAFADGVAGIGGPRRTPGEARAALSEAIDIIRASWAGGRSASRGPTIRPARCPRAPGPPTRSASGSACSGPRAVALVGAKADGWSVSAPYVPRERLAELNDIITGAALEGAVILSGSPGSTTSWG